MTAAPAPTAPAFILAFRGSVNRWECDENDHMNVRFYSRMVGEAIAEALAHWQVPAAGSVSLQHMRYLAEARLATPVSGWVAIHAVDQAGFTLLTELRHSATDVVLAAFLTRINGVGHGLNGPRLTTLPPHAGPRGLGMEDTRYGRLQLDAARAHGFRTVAKGVVQPQDCDTEGNLPLHAIMGRMSDAMPNLWAVLQTPEEQAARASGFQGGAVLEYRMFHHMALKANTRFEVISGVRDVTGKLQYFVHLLYDVATGRCVMSAEAVAVVLDLVTRRSVELSPERRQRMLAVQVKPLAPQAPRQ